MALRGESSSHHSAAPSCTPRFDPDTLPVETFDRVVALRSDQWPESPTAPMPPDFAPSPEAESILLQQLASPESSLTYLARINGTTVDALSLWMARPDIMEKCRAIVTAGMMQTKMVVATRLNMCVKGLVAIVAAAVEADTHTPAPIAFHDRRLREQQRRNSIRAITLILRCGRYDPFTPTRPPRDRNAADPLPIAHSPLPSPADPRLISNPKTWADLKDLIAQRDADHAATQHTPPRSDCSTYATGCTVGGSASASSSTPAPSHPHRTANVSERISSSVSSLPSQPVHPAGALPDLPLASALEADANSPAGALPDLPLASALKADANSDDANSTPLPSAALHVESSASYSSRPSRSTASSPPLRDSALSEPSVVSSPLPEQRARDPAA